MLYHVDGELVPADAASVDVRDRGFRYGDAAFETLRVYGGTPFAWERHAERLGETCDTLGFRDAMPEPATLRSRVDETLSANDLADASVRLSVTRGVQPGKLTPAPAVDPTVVITVSSLPHGGSAGERVWDEPATVDVAETCRIPDAAFPATAKTHNYLNGILGRLEIQDRDTDEVLFPSTDGFVTEGATSNVFAVRDGRLVTPSTTLPILPGITRAVVIELATAAEVPVETGRYRATTLATADELFLTNSTWELRPVGRLGETEFETGPVTRQLQERFDRRIDEHY